MLYKIKNKGDPYSGPNFTHNFHTPFLGFARKQRVHFRNIFFHPAIKFFVNSYLPALRTWNPYPIISKFYS